MIPGSANPLLLTSADSGFAIERSLRFNSGDSAYLNRTPSAAGNRKTWTLSFWVKKHRNSGNPQQIFGQYRGDSPEAQNRFQLYFLGSNELEIHTYSLTHLKTNRVFRDNSAWYHIVLAVDTTLSTADNRMRLYVNGVEETSFATRNNPSQNLDLGVNTDGEINIGTAPNAKSSYYADVNLAEIYFIDGQQLAATDFGEYDDNNVWQPKKFEGSYTVSGTALASATGALPVLNTTGDYGGTVASGVRSDSNASNIVLAVPMNGSNTGTTFTDYHHTIKGSGSAKAITVFSATTSTTKSQYYGSSMYAVRGAVNGNASDYISRTGDTDLAFGTGDFCVEFWINPITLVSNFGMFDNRHPTTNWPSSVNGFQFYSNSSGTLSLRTGGGSIITVNSVLASSKWQHLAVTRSSGTIKVFLDGVEKGSASNSNDFNEGRFLLGSTADNGEGSNAYFADLRIYKGVAKYTSNFTVPVVPPSVCNSFHLDFADNSSNAALGTDTSGISPANTWTTNNLVATAGVTPNQGFDVVTYTGNGGTQSISSLAFQPDFVWLKGRSQTNVSHQLYDFVRGTSKMLQSDNNTVESTVSGVSAFNSNGFTLGNNGGGNNSGSTYVAWCWKAGGAASSNSDGSITSSVSANAAYGFSVVTYTGTGSAATVGHGLNAAPKWVVVKRRDNANVWVIAHTGIGTNNLQFDGSAAYSPSSASGGGGISLGNSTTISPVQGTSSFVNSNASGGTYVAYCWSEVDGFSKFGSYTGNGSATGPVVTTGFKPRWIMVKGSSHASNWNIVDTARSSSNPQSNVLRANSAAAEFSTPTGQYGIAFDALDDGFQLKSGSSTNDVNQTGETYIYAAFAETGPGPAGIDSLVDTPTNAAEPTDTGVGNEVIGNYCTWNPLTTTTSMLLDGNLLSRYTSGAWKSALGTIGISSGKWYWENQLIDAGIGHMYGIALPTAAADSHNTDIFGVYAYDGKTYTAGAQNQSYASAFSPSDIIGVALDLTPGGTSGTLTYYKNGVSLGVAFSALDCSKTYFPWVLENGNASDGGTNTNFGARAFAHTAPSNHKALNTANLPTPTIADGSQYFEAKKYDGNGGTQTISNLEFSPDFTWLKKRSGSADHYLYDQVRGATYRLYSNTTDAESTSSTGLTAFTSDGFSLGNANDVNQSSNTYISWNWDAGTSTVTNNDGSIASQVRANPSAGFSIVSFDTGSASGNQSAGHGLNVTPALVIVKDRGATDHWFTWSSTFSSPTDHYLRLDGSQAVATSSGVWGAGMTSSVIGLSASAIGGNNIAYCFAPVAGYSQFSSFVGTQNADGPFIHTGFRPRWLLLRNATNTTGVDWVILDTARDTYNIADARLNANTSSAETTESFIDILSNGFKVRTGGQLLNGSGQTIIYAAFAENPFQANGGLAR